MDQYRIDVKLALVSFCSSTHLPHAFLVMTLELGSRLHESEAGVTIRTDAGDEEGLVISADDAARSGLARVVQEQIEGVV